MTDRFVRIADVLRSGAPVIDRELDDVFPPALILDVGAGVGKFCIVAAATVGRRGQKQVT